MLNRQTMAGGLVTVGGGMNHAEVEASSSTGRPRLCRATTPSHLTSNSDSRNGDEITYEDNDSDDNNEVLLQRDSNN